ncbi:hypothetical protein ACW2Q0_15280 [Nocardia sp. R16R-3T]
MAADAASDVRTVHSGPTEALGPKHRVTRRRRPTIPTDKPVAATDGGTHLQSQASRALRTDETLGMNGVPHTAGAPMVPQRETDAGDGPAMTTPSGRRV